MAYVVLKHSSDSKHTVIVNDSEGIAMEFDTHEQAQAVAELFQANTTHGSKYEVKKLS
jgi:hypothetical protein